MNPKPDHAELLQQLMDNIDDNIFFKDRDSRFIMINRANAAFFGLEDPQEAVGKDDFDFFDRDHAQRMREEELRIMDTGVPVAGEELVGGDGQHEGWGSVTKIPLRDKKGRIIGTMGIGRDISDLKQKEKELEQTNGRLRDINEQVAEDLRMAAELQQTFLPREYPEFRSPGGEPLLGFHHCYMPHSDLGGDFCSVYRLSDSMAGLFICDVMGHGVRAALVTGIIRALAEEVVRTCDGQPAAFMTTMNQRLAPILQAGEGGLFATAAFLTLDARSGELTCALAGHWPPLLIGPGRVEPLAMAQADTGPALAIAKDHRYAMASFRMQPGEAVLLYTDGITEAMNAAQEEFGQEGLLRAVRRCDGLSIEELVVRTTREVKDHVGEEPPDDDICMLGTALL